MFSKILSLVFNLADNSTLFFMKKLILTLTFLLFAVAVYSSNCTNDTIVKTKILLTIDNDWSHRNSNKNNDKEGSLNIDCYLTNYGIIALSELSQVWQYNITDLRNRTILEGYITPNNTIPLNGLGVGVYKLFFFNKEFLFQGVFTIE